MHKFFDVFGKGKRKKDFCNKLCCVEENVTNSLSPPKFVFKFYQFDSDCCSTNEITQPSSNTIPAPEKEIRGSIFHSPSGISPHTQDSPADFISETEKLCLSNSKELSSLFTQYSFPPVQNQKQGLLDRRVKSKKNIYVIHVNNSKSFHIGPQKTINIYGEQPLKDCARSIELPFIEEVAQRLEMDLSRLLDCEEKLNENFITKISPLVGKMWKEFGINLNLENTFLEEQEFQNGANGTLIVYDMLQYYISRFPNTSLGFVFYVLSETQQNQLFQQLARKSKSFSIHAT